jgi:hypothetical protein
MCHEPLLDLLKEGFFRAPGLIPSLTAAVEGGELSDTSTVAWLVLKLAARATPREDSAVRRLVDALVAAGAPAAVRLRTVFDGGATAAAVAAAQAATGGVGPDA